MKEKKYIDRLYQEKFKDFEAAPSEAVWKSISAKLKEEEKNRRKIAPFWYRIAGVAALLTLILLIGEWIFPVQTSPEVVNQELEQDLQKIQSKSSYAVAATDKEEVTSTRETSKNAISEAALSTHNERKSKLILIEPLNSAGISASKKEIAAANIPEKKEDKKIEIIRDKSLFDILKEKEDDITAGKTKRNFEVSTHAAPIYYGNLGKGNFLDAQFNNNSSEGEVTYSYGINIAYILSDKLKIRSGVSKVSMSYNTSGIAYHAVIGPVPISGVDLKAISENPRLIKDAQFGTNKQPIASPNRNIVGSFSPGALNQEMGFIEVPVELEYNIIDKRVEVNIIGGASTLFLDENRVFVSSGSQTATGSANNLNQVSFSTNFGLGLDYNLSERFKLNFEPMLKYQINTFDSAPAGTQPYYLGIYSGFSYKF